jgi:hypothetical protein
MGLPGEGDNTATEVTPSGYQGALAQCSGQSGIQVALDTMLAG